MKYLLLLLFPFLSFAQQESFQLCNPFWQPQYFYSFHIKYPLSSENLTEQANKMLVSHPEEIDGFITIRFTVNCKGQTSLYKTYQIDNKYQQTTFDQNYVETLLNFVKTLKNWPIARHEDKTFDYYTYFTFKIEHGIITEIIP